MRSRTDWNIGTRRILKHKIERICYMPSLDLVPATSEDFRRLAERRLPRPLFDYIDGGAIDEQTLRANSDAFRSVLLNQRVMRDVSMTDPRTELFGQAVAMPLALSPVGMAGMMARRAEVQAARAAEAANVPFCLSTVSICPLEEVASQTTQPFWFQLYMLKDRGHVSELLQRARNVGCRTLVFTVDLPIVGTRYRDVRNGMAGGLGLAGRLRAGLVEYASHPAWAVDVGLRGHPLVFGNIADYVPNARTPAAFKSWLDAQLDPSVTWKDIEWIRSIWPGDLVIKGILNVADAISATDVGADAIIVSNHGGRQLDSVSPTLRVLPRIAEAVRGRATVLIDSGVRNGQDVLKAIALGASAAMIGRPWIWAVAGGGERGLRNLLSNFKQDLVTTMSLSGVQTVPEISASALAAPKP